MRDAHDLYLLNMLYFCFAAVLCFDTLKLFQNYNYKHLISWKQKIKTYLIAFNKLWKDADMVFIEHEIGSLISISGYILECSCYLFFIQFLLFTLMTLIQLILN